MYWFRWNQPEHVFLPVTIVLYVCLTLSFILRIILLNRRKSHCGQLETGLPRYVVISQILNLPVDANARYKTYE